MSPSDANSSLAALRQLKEMLDAGTITAAEFETLKRQIIFGIEPALPMATPLGTDGPPTPAVSEASIREYETVAPPAPLPAAISTEAVPAVPPVAAPDWLASAAPSLLSFEERPLPPAEERRNPLNLVFIVGGVLVLLGIVLYLFIDRPSNPDEHLTSTSQTAADSTVTAPEVGPQAEQLTLPPAAAPETIRVAPAARPVAAPATSQLRADSAKPVTAPVKAAAVPSQPVPIDSAATKNP
ncbi:SHOCT domain-containing protein [Hymenobacter sp. BRD67]|uniref:SHOCT domain-containing protein n=1 Tax=Hymenobacter sp. BRD67 TaxID=2675877 RepID=UPI001567755E|nr:SHOCT domain-containing protein [Hymenobacter sp. BRD67]QKG53701.1 SHOCT domain-containing protein [Hymenobacter sp. BRD67]